VVSHDNILPFVSQEFLILEDIFFLQTLLYVNYFEISEFKAFEIFKSETSEFKALVFETLEFRDQGFEFI
jgi:hypothetical protein